MKPETIAKLLEVLKESDGIIDRALLAVVASRFSPAVVLIFALACIGAGVWIGHKP